MCFYFINNELSVLVHFWESKHLNFGQRDVEILCGTFCCHSRMSMVRHLGCDPQSTSRNGHSVRVLGFVNGFKQTPHKCKNYRGFHLKGKLVGEWAGQRSIEDLRQNLAPKSNWMLFSLLDGCFSLLPISHSYLYAAADSTAVKKVPLKSEFLLLFA